MAQSGSNKKVANSLVAVSASAVLAVYAAGYARTRSAADRLDAQSAERRPAAPSAAKPAPATPGSAPAVYDWARDEGGTPTKAKIPADAAPTPSASAAPVPSQSAHPVPPAADHRPEAAPAVPVTTSPAAPVVVASAAAPTATAPAPVTPAPTSAEPTPAAAPPAAKWKDGAYTGWGTCRHGDIQAEVVIEGGRITSATIAQCLTRYSCNVIGRLPPEVLERQSAEVDYVSGATQSANAFYYAVLEALGKAK